MATTTTTVASDLSNLTLGELWEEVIWIGEQPNHAEMTQDANRILQEIARRQENAAAWAAFLEG